MIDLPEKFLKRMKSELKSEYQDFLDSYARPAEKGVRVNTLKSTVEDFEKLSPVRLDGKIEWEQSGFYAQGEGLGKNVFYAAGLYYVQEPSAMSVVPNLDVKSGERVLDLCAAPGGKSTQIAQYMQGCGVLVLNEIDRARYKILKSNVERAGVKNAAVLNYNPESLAEKFADYFDKILVDAPCSGEGMFKKEEAAISGWSLENVRACAVRQSKILDSADKMLAAGGRLVYSTCTFAPDENEGQIEKFLTSHTGYKLILMQKLYPHKARGEGHFYAVLDKNEGRRVNDGKLKITPRDGQEFNEFKKGVIKSAYRNIVKFGDGVYSLTDGATQDIRAGLKLGEIKGNRFEPSHALAMSLKSGADEFANLEVDEGTALNYLRGLTFSVPECHKGWRIVTYKGFPLGWCKVVDGVAKNHLPKGLRI